MEDQYNGNNHEQNHAHENENNSNNNASMKNDFKEHLDGAMGTFNEIKNPGKFCVKTEFMNAIEILKLNEKKMQEIATRKTTATAALLFILIGVVAMGLGTQFMLPGWLRPSMGYMLISMLFNLVMVIVGIFALDFVANQFFKGKGDFGQLFRVFGYSYILMIPYILLPVAPGLYSIIGAVAGIWMLVVMFKTMGLIKKLNVVHTIFSLLIVGVALGIVMTIFMNVFGIGYGFGIGGGSAVAEINDWTDALNALGDINY
ncbi:YIP1 family protein [Patescibacteria group bacterium]|nr:YIP1 family protein [Patescibacteria group bacterium]